MKPAESANLVGSVLDGRYSILREIGRGGMGVVYEAEHVELGKHVAVKVLLDKYQDDDEAVIRFKREALAASRIGSPHIIDVQHIGAAPDGRPYVAMELLEGESLAAIMKRTGPMEPWRALHIIRQVLRATGAAHAKGIVHRDLKPDNIFIVNRDDQQDFVKLLDFGISKFLETTDYSIKTKLTTTGAVMGTPLYMAPEQAMGA
ncbi:MAG TPA: serine/threonine-protein kinase, partial [Kofleriaceae bacterium]